MQVNHEKAFDEVDREFLYKIMKKLGDTFYYFQ